MSAVLRVTHTVEDIDDWKAVFDNHESNRRLHGATAHRVLRDGNEVTIAIDFPDRASAEAFAKDPSLKEAMSKAGVTSAPQLAYFDTVEAVKY